MPISKIAAGGIGAMLAALIESTIQIPVSAATYDWSGWYIGAAVGGIFDGSKFIVQP